MTDKRPIPKAEIKHDLAYWRWVYRTSGGWRGVRWCLNCLYGPRAWERIVVDWWRDLQLRRMIRRMTPEQRAEMAAIFKVLDAAPKDRILEQAEKDARLLHKTSKLENER